jgi:hypothetical protein
MCPKSRASVSLEVVARARRFFSVRLSLNLSIKVSLLVVVNLCVAIVIFQAVVSDLLNVFIVEIFLASRAQPLALGFDDERAQAVALIPEPRDDAERRRDERRICAAHEPQRDRRDQTRARNETPTPPRQNGRGGCDERRRAGEPCEKVLSQKQYEKAVVSSIEWNSVPPLCALCLCGEEPPKRFTTARCRVHRGRTE